MISCNRRSRKVQEIVAYTVLHFEGSVVANTLRSSSWRGRWLALAVGCLGGGEGKEATTKKSSAADRRASNDVCMVSDWCRISFLVHDIYVYANLAIVTIVLEKYK